MLKRFIVSAYAAPAVAYATKTLFSWAVTLSSNAALLVVSLIPLPVLSAILPRLIPFVAGAIDSLLGAVVYDKFAKAASMQLAGPMTGKFLSLTADDVTTAVHTITVSALREMDADGQALPNQAEVAAYIEDAVTEARAQDAVALTSRFWSGVHTTLSSAIVQSFVKGWAALTVYMQWLNLFARSTAGQIPDNARDESPSSSLGVAVLSLPVLTLSGIAAEKGLHLLTSYAERQATSVEAAVPARTQ
jgi:hypothetical protein